MSLRFVEMTVGGFAGAEGAECARGVAAALGPVGRVLPRRAGGGGSGWGGGCRAGEAARW